jgi:hypothetical protein
MELEWILLAEGFGTNGVGAVTAISINQNVVVAAALPAPAKRVILAHFVSTDADQHDLDNAEVTVTAQAVSPSGAIVFAHTAGGRFPPPTWPDLPRGLDVAVELQLRLTEYGRHEIRVSAVAANREMSGSTYLFVKEPPA